MPVTEHPMQALAAYLPDGCFEPVVAYIHHYKVHLTVTKQRKTVLGDYRNNHFGGNHRISINGNLNKYEFLITLLHELAHLLTFEKYRNTVEPHGKEWKRIYGELLLKFVQMQVFPPDVNLVLQKSILNPSATANGETELLKILRNYNTQVKEGYCLVEQLPDGAFFITEAGRQFQKVGKRRKRFECLEIATGKRYSFSPIAEVKKV
ncbi:MAG: SprT-like domain-containing protein [Chitinophagaceae bacterium]